MADWMPIRGVVVDVLPNLNIGMTEWEMYPERFEFRRHERQANTVTEGEYMVRRIDAPYKPKKGDPINFRDPDGNMVVGIVKKILDGGILHVEVSRDKWFELEVETDVITLAATDDPHNL